MSSPMPPTPINLSPRVIKNSVDRYRGSHATFMKDHNGNPYLAFIAVADTPRILMDDHISPNICYDNLISEPNIKNTNIFKMHVPIIYEYDGNYAFNYFEVTRDVVDQRNLQNNIAIEELFNQCLVDGVLVKIKLIEH